MSQELRRRLFDQLDALTLVDPHTHINPRQPASRTLADILGYHYYTELAHSAGLAKDEIEDPVLTPRAKVRRLIENLGPIDNTIQWSWLLEMSQKLFGFEGDEINRDNWESLYDAAEDKMASAGWSQEVLDHSKVRSVFLTNDFDDDLTGYDTSTYIPCLRTDDLVFHLAKSETQQRLERATGVTLGSADSLRQAIGTLFDTFTANGARACAISLPPDFAPTHVSDARANTAIDAMLSRGVDCGDSHRRAAANFVFWTLAEYCNEYRMPFDLMIGVNRNVYPNGVHQGRDLYDSRVSLIQYKDLFNGFPEVTFPISVLASVTNQELVSYSWIFPNIVTNGHWWYSNTPAYIEHDLAARLEAVPRTKQIGYYSDAYKLEFVLPKFAMYKRILAKVLAERFVIDRGWSEERAFELGKQVLVGNVNRVFTEAQRPTVVMGRSRDSRVFSREISMSEAEAAAAAGTLGTFYNERIEPTSGEEADDFDLSESRGDADVESVGANDLGPLDLDERDQGERSEVGSFVAQENGGSNVLDQMELQPSFGDDDLDSVEPLEMLPADEVDEADEIQPIELDAADEPPPVDYDELITSQPPVTEPTGSTDAPPELEVMELEEQPLDLGLDTRDEPAEQFDPVPISPAEEAWSPFKDPVGQEVHLPNPVEEMEHRPHHPHGDEPIDLGLEGTEPAEELDLSPIEEIELDEDLPIVAETPAEADAPPASSSDVEDEITELDIVAEEEDPGKTQVGPFQFPDAPPKKDAGGWDFLNDDKK
jgi:glucuronate isomerase